MESQNQVKDLLSKIEELEKDTHMEIRNLFKHNIFNCALPDILYENLDCDNTWNVLGLSPKQLAAAAALAGAMIGATFDLAAGGITFGVFTAIGLVSGAGGVALGGGKKLVKTKVVGLSLGK